MALKASAIKVGDKHSEQVADNLTRTQIVQYAGASGDYNPIHTDDLFATKVAGYPTVFAHGMLTMGMTGMMLTNWVGDGQLRSFGVRFTQQVWPGDSLAASAVVTAIEERDGERVATAEVTTENQKGDQVLKGTACFALT